MTDTNRAAAAQARRESPSLDAVQRAIEEQVGSDKAARVAGFAELFFAKAPADLIQERSPEALARMALDAFRALEAAGPDDVHVEVASTPGDTVVRTVVSDRPFIIDSLREAVAARNLTIGYLVYPSPYVRRDRKGKVVEVRRAAPGEARHSIVHCEVTPVSDPAEVEALRAEVLRRLQDVVKVTDDFEPMQKAVDKVVGELDDRAKQLPSRAAELNEIAAFLRWLRDGGFVFLGYRAYDVAEVKKKRQVSVESGSGLGILRDEESSAYAGGVPLDQLDPVLRARTESGPVLITSKTNAEATVHRSARMDYIGVKKLDKAGKPVGEHRFVGLFTSRAYAEDAEEIPILREKLRQILESAGVVAGSHDFKEIKSVFNSMPKEGLLLASPEELGADIRLVMNTYDADEVRVALREDALHRGVTAMVIIPGERYSGTVRDEIEEVLVRALDGEVLNFHLALTGDQARLHYYIAGTPERIREASAEKLEESVGELMRSWTDRVREALLRATSEEEARKQAWRYTEALSPEYQASTHPDVAVRDILELEAMQAEGRKLSVALSNSADMRWVPGDDPVTELKLYLIGERLVLSDFMPILENAGLRVIAVNPYELKGGGIPPALISVFAVQDKEGKPVDVAERGPAIAQTILAVRSGDLSNDILNGLVLATGLHWREVDVLRAYSTYAFQIGAVPARFALPWALLKYPAIARQLFELFQIKFDPDSGASLERRREVAREAKAAIVAALTNVTLLADDRALRRLLTLVEATVRTNYYRSGGRVPTRRSGGVPYTSLKFACDAFQSVTKSRLMFEVWVRSSRMEGVHLRGAKVARGGIRWSDRLDDFRTEILGLVKTQMVKNAVIVPGGSKGGFVLLKPPANPELLGEEGKEQYRTLIRGLLDVTDNLDPTSGALLPPERVVAFDDPDPYLVVAADKGTAKFSDVANGISAEYGFWLADAFASGGSNGYDHKTVGITAMGGWECVKRHFREMGKDIQTEPFSVVGIGDMSGDVFGNGMLLSRKIRLLAAFDHRHVFLDPDPDPEKSFKERERMFKLPRSSWADYDTKLLSKGGMIVPRGAKEVTLAPSVIAALGLPEGTGPMDGETLIRAVLKAPVELLWNGGIGTYVKSSEETNADAGDPTNDAVRVDAGMLRCKVVGEGGNLGFTQQARIQYAEKGGRINTDALDNSGGVDLSDHEVNLKILLNPVVRAGQITAERRNKLLEELTNEVATLVLLDNRSQSRAISLDEVRAKESGDDFRDLISGLEKVGLLDRSSETLPTFEVITERYAEGGTFQRPELCVLLAYGKLWLKSEVLKSTLPDDPVLDSYLVNYFPAGAVKEAGDAALRSHRLRREIVTTQLASDLVDLMGSAFVMRLVRDTGRGAHEVARAWTIAARLSDHRALIKQMGSQGKPVPYAVAYRWLLGLARVLERTTRWVLQNVPAERPTAQVVADYKDGIGALRGHFGELVAGEDRALYEERVAELGELGADEALARDLITLRFLDQLLEIIRVGKETGASPVDAARAYYRVSELLSVPWIRKAIFDTAEEDRWEQRAAQALADDLSRAHHKLVARVMLSRNGADIDSATTRLIQSREREVARYRALLDEIRAEPAMSLSGLSVAVREIAILSEGMNGGAP
jgi:glutamate dehydrogenase